MSYLIDGHNLIGQLPTIALSDPDDEAKLVRLLQRFAMRHRARIVVFFDRGSYGQSNLGGNGVKVIFARSPEDADRRIAAYIRKLAQPQNWALVTTDSALRHVAQSHGLRMLHAADFAQRLLDLDRSPPSAGEHAEAQVRVTGKKLDQWFELFGVDAEEASRPVDFTKRPVGVERRRARSTYQPETDERRSLDPSQSDPNRPVKATRRSAGRKERRTRRAQSEAGWVDARGRRLIKPPPPQPDEIDEWLRLFGASEEEQ